MAPLRPLAGFVALATLLATSPASPPQDAEPWIVLATADARALQSHVGPFAVEATWPSLPGFLARLTPSQAAALAARPDVSSVRPDEMVEGPLASASSWTGTLRARAVLGADGDRDGDPRRWSPGDVVVCLVDSGVDARHRDLDQGQVIAFVDLVNRRATPYDDHGHGTHTAGIVAGQGDGGASGRGVAPGAAIVAVKVLDADNRAPASRVVSGIDWCVQNRARFGIEIVTAIAQSAAPADRGYPTAVAAQRAWEAGLVVVVPAGNRGPGSRSVTAPGSAPDPITVGSVGDPGSYWHGWVLARSSGRGPTLDGALKPDLAGPGLSITAPRPGGGYATRSGTSMSTPFVAGVAALMLDANPALSNADVKRLLRATSRDAGAPGWDAEWGAGIVDAYSAVAAARGGGSQGGWPPHAAFVGRVQGTGAEDEYSWTLAAGERVGVTLVGRGPGELDLRLRGPSGELVAASGRDGRHDALGWRAATAGTYRLEVVSRSGAGAYVLDVSGGRPQLSADG